MCVYVCMCMCVCMCTPERRKGEREQWSEWKRAIVAKCVLWGNIIYKKGGGLLLKTLKDSRGILKHKINRGDLSSGASKSISPDTTYWGCLVQAPGSGNTASIVIVHNHGFRHGLSRGP
jgi:hypothetical protein